MPTVPVVPSGRTQAELNSLRYNTSSFIAANPSVITLIPRLRLKSGTGVTWEDQEPRATQVLRVIDQSSSRSATPGTVTGSDGKQYQAEFQLLGCHDAEIGQYDYWVHADGLRYEVAEMLPHNGYEVRALVVRYGQ